MRKLLFILLLLVSVGLNGQINLTIAGIDSAVTGSGGYNIAKAAPTLLIFRNNKITSTYVGTGFILYCGTDDYEAATATNLDNAVISGNMFIWDGASGSGPHGVMAGYNENYDIKYNYIDSSAYGVVHEGGYTDHTPMASSSGGIYYNIIKDTKYSVVEKGYDGTHIYNNTFYTNRNDALWFVLVRGSDTGGDLITAPYPQSKNVKIKNNIFYNAGTGEFPAIYLGETGDNSSTTWDTIGFECDYNIYFYEHATNNEPHFRGPAGQYITWTQWRALGYDEHSVILNPNFIDTDDFVPTARIDRGTALGASYDDGLSVSATWVVNSAPTTSQQNGTWQVGARVYASPVSYTAHYVATPANGGNDANAGTYVAPWATWGKAFTSTDVTAGDTVYFREGVYYKSKTEPSGYFYNTTGYGYNITRDGTAGNLIHYMNYPGETPVLDCYNIIPSGATNRGIQATNVNYIHFRGLTLRNVRQVNTGVEALGWYLIDYNTGLIFENCVTHNIGGYGFVSTNGHNTYYINCDSYNNCDSLASVVPGNNGAGFQTRNISDTTGTTYYQHCRAWNNSDDGFAFYDVAYVEMDSCWSFNNGQLDGDGNGFKLGFISSAVPAKTLLRRLTNSIAAYNDYEGIRTNESGTGSAIAITSNVYNNTSYKNGFVGFNISNTGSTDAKELKRIFRNNISYDNAHAETWIDGGALYTHSNNTWDASVTVTDADFISLDSTGLTAARQLDGSLPNINFLKLAATSDLINAGTDVGLDFEGAAPDMGAYEFTGFDEEPSAPYIATTTPYAITTNRGMTGGYMISDGGGTISAKGVCWSTSANPDLTDNVVSGGSGTDDFIVTISGLSSHVTYYVRAFAINENGTSYGANEQFTTSQSSIVKFNRKTVKR